MVKPVLEYGCSVWDPHTKNQIDNLDRVQKNAARFVLNVYSFTKGSTERNLNTLKWTSLREDRAKIKTTLLYKGINGLICIPTDQYKTKSNRINTRNSGYQSFMVPSSSVDCHLHSFFPSTIRLWNTLPYTTKSLGNIETFKRSLQYTTLIISP